MVFIRCRLLTLSEVNEVVLWCMFQYVLQVHCFLSRSMLVASLVLGPVAVVDVVAINYVVVAEL